MQELTITFDGRVVEYDYSDLDELVLAYAVSLHKGQGSEYPCVVIFLLTQHYILLQWNLLYTAITSGKRLAAQFSVTQRLASSGQTLYKWGSVIHSRIIVWPNRH